MESYAVITLDQGIGHKFIAFVKWCVFPCKYFSTLFSCKFKALAVIADIGLRFII